MKTHNICSVLILIIVIAITLWVCGIAISAYIDKRDTNKVVPTNLTLEKCDSNVEGEDLYILIDHDYDKEYILIRAKDSFVVTPRIRSN